MTKKWKDRLKNGREYGIYCSEVPNTGNIHGWHLSTQGDRHSAVWHKNGESVNHGREFDLVPEEPTFGSSQFSLPINSEVSDPVVKVSAPSLGGKLNNLAQSWVYLDRLNKENTMSFKHEDDKCTITCNTKIISVTHDDDKVYVMYLRDSIPIAYAFNLGNGRGVGLGIVFEPKAGPWKKDHIQYKTFLLRDKGSSNFRIERCSDVSNDMFLPMCHKNKEWSHSVKGPWFPCDEKHIP